MLRPTFANNQTDMDQISTVILSSGRSAVELALFILLPIMIVMLSLMRWMESVGWLTQVVRFATPALRPFGLNGLGVFAVTQVLFVSFAAPMATLAIMAKNGCSPRHIAATLAIILALAQGNVTFPMSAVGLDIGSTILIALIGGLVASASTWYLFARQLPTSDEKNTEDPLPDDDSIQGGLLAVIRRAGKDAWDIAMAALPMLVVSLVVVNLVRMTAVIDGLQQLASPLTEALGYPDSTLLLVITKYVAGGTAMMGVTMEQISAGTLTSQDINLLSGLLNSPLDVAGVAVLISVGRKISAVAAPAIMGAAIGILVRTLLHSALYL